MYNEDKELLFIKHCSNLQRVSVEQLQAIKEEKQNIVNELTAQKQIIMESIASLQEEFAVKDCQPEIRERLKNLLSQIAISENESQQIIKERCTDISKKMLAIRKELNIQQAYEDHSFLEPGSLCNIQK
jgi:hypothetical protein